MNLSLADTTFEFSLFLCGLYGATGAWVLARRKAHTSRLLRLTLGLLLGAAAFQTWLNWNGTTNSRALAYGLLAASVLLVFEVRKTFASPSFLGNLLAGLAGALWAAGFVLADFLAPQLSGEVWAAGWIALKSAALGFVAGLYRRSPQSMLRRQILYWVVLMAWLTLGEALFVLGVEIWWGLPHALGIAALAYVASGAQLPDFLRSVRKTSEGLLLAMTAGGLFAASYALTGMLFASDNALRLPAAIIFSLAGFTALFDWLIMTIQPLVNRVIPLVEIDQNRILREYSLSLSSVLDPDRLATVAIGLISEAIEVRKGMLLLVAHEQLGENNGYRLKSTSGMGVEGMSDGYVNARSPIALYFTEQRQPLTQADLSFGPAYKPAIESERAWFTALKMELYIPIYAKDEWVGLMALGSKAYGQPYREEDLKLLQILADQTAVALQNARLVESLMRVNNDFRRAYSALETSNRQLGRANTQLQKLDKAKTDFIAIASHELRTPLTVMRGYTEMLQDDPLVTGNSYYKKLVAGIHSGIMRFHEIVDSMLDIAMIDNSTLNLSLGDVSLDVLIRIIGGGLKDALAERKINLSLDHLQGLHPIQGDPEALRKVFYHLIVNAVKYTPDGGQITVSGRSLPPGDANFPEDAVEIVVADTGIGIDPEFHDLIFAKFYQTGEIALHSSGKTKFKGGGPGLGLTIAKGIVEAHGGRIWVESPGHDEEHCPGSQFHVILPIRRRG